MGVKAKAHTIEITIMMVTIQPNCWKRTPVIPVTNVNGKNTAISVNVDATTESPTSFVP